MNHVSRIGAVLLFVLAGSTLRLSAQQADSSRTTATRTEEAAPLVLNATRTRQRSPRVDGRMNEPIWHDADVATYFVQSEPRPGQPSTERTDVRVVYDGRALYIAARMLDSRPDLIHGPLARRDEDIESDWFYVYLDSDADRATSFVFGVNPRGVMRDYAIREDGRPDLDWHANWHSAAVVDSTGWTVEMRIPLSQLRFAGPDRDGDNAPWGINFQRRIARNGEVSSWAPVPRNRRQVVASFGRLDGLRNLRNPIRFELVPYSVGRMTAPAGPDETPYFGTVGADLTLGIGQGLSLAATFNPDFGQVEADPAVVNVSGYRTFFPEKRPFFIQDQGLLAYSVGRTRIFHSRRIGRDVERSDGTRSSLRFVPDASGILAASRLSGRTSNGWSIGLLHALTNAASLEAIDSVGVETIDPVEPRTNYAVAKITKEYAEGRGSAGMMLTFTDRALRPDMEGMVSRASVGGLTWSRRSQDGTHEINAAILGSHVQGDTRAMHTLQTAHGRYLQRPDAGHLRYDSLRTSLTGFAARLDAARVGGNWIWGVGSHALSPTFEVNDLGHQREADLAHQYGYAGFDRVGPAWILRRQRIVANQWADWSFGGERLATGVGGELNLQFSNFWSIVGYLDRHLEALSTDLLRGGPALRTPGRTTGRVILQTDRRKTMDVRLDGSLHVEDEDAGRTRILRAGLNLRPSGIAAVTLEPGIVQRSDQLEYVTTRATDEENYFVFGRVDQRTLSLLTRLDVAFSTSVSLQLYAQPYLVNRRVSDFARVIDPKAPQLDSRIQPFPLEAVHYDSSAHRYVVVDGASELSFPEPGFTYGQLSSNVVLRWEARPGSTLFVAWSRDARDRRRIGDLDPIGSLGDLVGLGNPAPSTNVFLIKLSYRLGP